MTDRTLAHIALDIRLASKERGEADARCMSDPNDRRAEEAFASADDRLAELKDEFKAKFRAVTGVSWTTVEDLNL
jgi:hypothetical protein